MNGPRLTALAVEHYEAYEERYEAALANDGVICAVEDAELRPLRQQLHVVLMDADEGIGLAVTMLRRGPDSVSLKRRMVERGLRLAKGDDDAKDAA